MKLTMFAVPEAAGVHETAAVEAMQREDSRLQFESPTKTGREPPSSFDMTCRSVVVMYRSEKSESSAETSDFIMCSCQVFLI
jgi:hypothetical protein